LAHERVEQRRFAGVGAAENANETGAEGHDRSLVVGL
jgi:hypothetical protein